MQCLEPQRVCNKDIFSWIKQSFELVNRRILANLFVISFFFLVVFLSSQTLVVSSQSFMPVFMLFGFLIFTAFVFYLIIASLVFISHSSNHSHALNLSNIIYCFMPSQKVVLKLALFGILAGLFFWYVSILVNPETNVMTYSASLVNLLSNDHLVIHYIMKTSAVFLFFVLASMFSLRNFFSLPLILFHGLSYEEAGNLSHRGIIKNITVMSNVLFIWAIVTLLVIKLAPVLIIFLLPLFACFNYVTYRHIYLGEGLNEKIKAHQSIIHYSRS